MKDNYIEGVPKKNWVLKELKTHGLTFALFMIIYA